MSDDVDALFGINNEGEAESGSPIMDEGDAEPSNVNAGSDCHIAEMTDNSDHSKGKSKVSNTSLDEGDSFV